MPPIKDQIDKALEIVRGALVPFVEHSLASRYPGSDWFAKVNARRLEGKQLERNSDGSVKWSPDNLLKTMATENWDAFKTRFKPRSTQTSAHIRTKLGDLVAKGWIEELMEIRHRAMHQEALTQHDVFRFCDTAELLLRAADCDAGADLVHDLLADKAYLEVSYPDEYESDFKNANELWITGTNLRRIIVGDGSGTYLRYIRDVLSRKGVVKVLMNHPDSCACKYAMMQDGGPASDLEAYRRQVRKNLGAFCKLRSEATNGRNLLIRTIDYMLTFGLDIMNGNDEERGIVYVRFYPLPGRNAAVDDRPIVRLNQHDSRWYNFFKQQFELHWNDEANDGWAVDFPLDYTPS